MNWMSCSSLSLSYGIISDVGTVPDEVLQLVQERINAKEAQDYTLADTIRQQIKNEYGYAIKDVKGGAPIISPVE